MRSSSSAQSHSPSSPTPLSAPKSLKVGPSGLTETQSSQIGRSALALAAPVSRIVSHDSSTAELSLLVDKRKKEESKRDAERSEMEVREREEKEREELERELVEREERELQEKEREEREEKEREERERVEREEREQEEKEEREREEKEREDREREQRDEKERDEREAKEREEREAKEREERERKQREERERKEKEIELTKREAQEPSSHSSFPIAATDSSIPSGPSANPFAPSSLARRSNRDGDSPLSAEPALPSFAGAAEKPPQSPLLRPPRLNVSRSAAAPEEESTPEASTAPSRAGPRDIPLSVKKVPPPVRAKPSFSQAPITPAPVNNVEECRDVPRDISPSAPIVPADPLYEHIDSQGTGLVHPFHFFCLCFAKALFNFWCIFALSLFLSRSNTLYFLAFLKDLHLSLVHMTKMCLSLLAFRILQCVPTLFPMTLLLLG